MKDNRIITIIIKQLKGQANAEEEKELQHWEQKATENRTESNALRQTWKLSHQYDRELTPDVEVGLSRLKSRMAQDRAKTVQSPPAKSKQVVFRLSRFVMRAAAAAAVLFSIGFLAKNYLQPSNKPFIVSTTSNQEKVELTDGSVVWLNANSQLIFSSPNNRTERRATLIGEAFFEVQRNPAKPFILETNDAQVKVLGTSFNVRAIPDENFTEVQVKTGTVAFQAKNAEKPLILEANEKGTYKHTDSQPVKEIDPSLNALSWHSKNLSFRNTPLKKVLQDLERYYQVHLELGNTALENCGFTSPFIDSNLSEVLKTIEISFGMQLEKIDSKNYRLKGGSCK